MLSQNPTGSPTEDRNPTDAGNREASLREAERRLRLQRIALEATPNAIVITDRDGKIEWVNAGFTAITGYELDEVRGRTPVVLKSGLHDEAFYRDLWETILSGERWRGELQNRRKDGSLYAVEETISPVLEGGEITHFVAVQEDITERKRREERIQHLAFHDPLTDLPNRRVLEEELERLVAKSRRGRKAALLLSDLDNLKAVNEAVGHQAGDRFLVELVPVLGAALRASDLLARMGGDEFAALLEDVEPDEALAIAERLREAVARARFQAGDYTFRPSVSVGVAALGPDGDGEPADPAARTDPTDGTTDAPDATTDGPVSAAELLTRADTALQAAKERGRNRVVSYGQVTERERGLTEASQWAHRISDALHEDRFVLHFQPLVSLRDDVVVGHEVLLRLRERDGELVPPGAFLPAAERFGLMPEVDGWVLDSVLPRLRDSERLRASVNLSGFSLGDEGFMRKVGRRLEGFEPESARLSFEITETAVVRDLGRARHWMDLLRNLGCRFLLDDFGMGFSSFTYLRALPVDRVKIDGSFIKEVSNDPSTASIVQGMTIMAHALGKEVIAERVEDEETAGMLREFGVDYGQGWLWGKPAVELD